MDIHDAISLVQSVTSRIKGFYKEELTIDEPWINLASRFADSPGTVLLMSGGEHDCAGHHILAVHPWLSIRTRGRKITIRVGDRFVSLMANPFDLLRAIRKLFSFRITEGSIPVYAGLFGYLAYDLKDAIETLPRTSIDDLELPDICLFAPAAILVQDRLTQNICLCIPVRELHGQSLLDAERRAFFDVLCAKKLETTPFSVDASGFRSPFTQESYMAAIQRIREYIVSGHIYQVNLSQRFEASFSGHPFSLFHTLFHKAPAPFYAYIHAGDHHIVSTSPERFLMRRGNLLETRPIKGTRPRGKSPQEDEALCREIQTSPKDDAELSMIVDLMRNDLGKVCKPGSVVVSEHKRLEAYRNVFHLISVITGKIEDNVDSVEIIRATFPGGSITGCPKIRAMEIIDELEPCRRHIYTGSIGYIGFHDTMDLSIAIRTITFVGRRMLFSVGGGIVYDSDPAAEYEETLHKGRSIIEAFQGRVRPTLAAIANLWHNGSIRDSADAMVSAVSKGVQYGYGFFETLRADNGKIQALEDHIERFEQTWEVLFERPKPDLSWEEIIHQVLSANALLDQTAAVKILALYGEGPSSDFKPELIVTALAYTHRLIQLGKTGLDLLTYPHPRQTPLADHKTTNYLHYFLAGQWAKRLGADEALILNPDGSVSETNTANLLAIRGRNVIRPASAHVLAGIMEKRVLRWFEANGYTLERKNLMPEDLLDTDGVILTNSLMGPVAVLSLDGKRLPDTQILCSNIRTDDMSTLEYLPGHDTFP